MKASAKTFDAITRSEAVTLDISAIRIPVASFEVETEEEYHEAFSEYLDSLASATWGERKIEVEGKSTGVHEIAVRVCDSVVGTLEADTVIVRPVGWMNFAVISGEADKWCEWIDSEMSHGSALANLGAMTFIAYLAGLWIAKDVAKEVFSRYFDVSRWNETPANAPKAFKESEERRARITVARIHNR